MSAITNAVAISACAYIIITPTPPPSLPEPIINSPTIAPITDNPADILNPAWDIWHGGHFMEVDRQGDILWEHEDIYHHHDGQW